MEKVWIVTCEECGLVTVNTATNYAHKNSTDHYDEHNGSREVTVYEAIEIGKITAA